MPAGLAMSAADVRDAAAVLAGVAVRTPLLEFDALNDQAGTRVLVKFEGAQRTGSFKFRGAYNRLARIAASARAAGVVAGSSGNHGQGVAAAAKLLGMPATIVMPADAPAIKIANTRAHGAEIVFYDRTGESRDEIAEALVARKGATLIPPFDDPFVIAGQGTVGLEMIDQARQLDATIGRVLVCCGGGGLASGVATVIKDAEPDVDIYCVEPTAFDDTARSLGSGTRESIAKGARSICDALQTPCPGRLTFPILQALLSGALVVDDDQVKAAMRFAFERMKLVVEPGGAVALAAVLHHLVPPTADATAIVISGSNVDAGLYASILTERSASAA